MAAIGDPDEALRLDTTRGLDAVARFPELAGLPAALASHRLVLDGEAVAFDEKGRPSFGRLQHRMHLSKPADVTRVARRIRVSYVVFDPAHPRCTARHLHIRIKVKVRPRQEFRGRRLASRGTGLTGKFGSLLVGVYEGERLRYAGKVGTGYSDQERDRVCALLADHAIDQSPFDPMPPREVSRTAHWVRPALVAEVAFAEWTSSGTLRHPSHVALRDDKEPHEVVREA